MRIKILGGRLALLTAGVSAVALVAAAPAGAAAAKPAASTIKTVTGGSSISTTPPGGVLALVQHTIAPLPLGAAKITTIGNLNDALNATLTTSFPVVGGKVDTAKLFAGDLKLGGSIEFLNLVGFRSVTLKNLDVVQGSTPKLNAHVNATTDDGKVERIFEVDLSKFKLDISKKNTVTLDNIALTVSSNGASVLNGWLHTDYFHTGLVFGTGSTTFTYAG